MTEAQKSALAWLRNRGGDGVFTLAGVLLCRGDLARVMRKTWRDLERAGLVERYQVRRLRVTALGLRVDLRRVAEAGTVEDLDE